MGECWNCHVLLFMLSQRQQEWQVLLSQVPPCLFGPTVTSHHIFIILVSLCLPSYRGLELPELLLLEEYFPALPFWEGVDESHSVTKFKLRPGWEGGKEREGMGESKRKGGRRKLIMSIFSGHLCSSLLPLILLLQRKHSNLYFLFESLL